MDSIRVQVCGRLAVVVDGERVEGRLPSRQGRLLFTYLVAHRHRPTPRTELVDAVWPGALPAKPDVALRTLLSKLRAVLGPELLAPRDEPRLVLPSGAFVDLEAAHEGLHRAESAIARGAWADAWAPARVALHTADREILPGEHAPWVEELRRRMDDVRLRALEAVAAVGLGLGGAELVSAERSGQRLVQLAPLRESGWLRLMRAHAARGNVAEALVAYERLRVLLREELGAVPGAALQELHRELLRG